MLRSSVIPGLVVAVALSVVSARADERGEAMALLREAFRAQAEAATAATPVARLQALETAAGVVARLIAEYSGTYVGLRLAAGQPIGPLDPPALRRELELARTAVATAGESPPRATLRSVRQAAAPRPCETGPTTGAARSGAPKVTLADVIADCRSALAFAPGSARWRFQLARALAERGHEGDRQEAVDLLEAAAADGWAPAKTELCARYRWGIGTAKDPARARFWCEAAAGEAVERDRATSLPLTARVDVR